MINYIIVWFFFGEGEKDYSEFLLVRVGRWDFLLCELRFKRGGLVRVFFVCFFIEIVWVVLFVFELLFLFVCIRYLCII